MVYLLFYVSTTFRNIRAEIRHCLLLEIEKWSTTIDVIYTNRCFDTFEYVLLYQMPSFAGIVM